MHDSEVRVAEIEGVLGELKTFTDRPEMVSIDEFDDIMKRSEGLKKRVVEAFEGSGFSRESDQLIKKISDAQMAFSRSQLKHISEKQPRRDDNNGLTK